MPSRMKPIELIDSEIKFSLLRPQTLSEHPLVTNDAVHHIQ
jgi:hypothetical protein